MTRAGPGHNELLDLLTQERTERKEYIFFSDKTKDK